MEDSKKLLKFDETGTTVTKCYWHAKDIIIPKGVTKIDDEAFKDCTSLASIEIPNSVTEIGNNAFYNCM